MWEEARRESKKKKKTECKDNREGLKRQRGNGSQVEGRTLSRWRETTPVVVRIIRKERG